MSNSKTIFCDIDGTLWKHIGDCYKQSITEEYNLLNNTKEAIAKWDKLGYKIILTTGRKDSLRKKTEEQLSKLGIVYDILLMGLGNCSRIIINDKKIDCNKNTCYSINIPRNKGLQYYDFTSNYVTISDDQPKIVNKPWGKEELIEYNDNYVVKKLFMKKNECCSLQYHEVKKETIYVLKGKLKIYIGSSIDKLETKIILPGDNITILPNTIHRLEGIEDSEYLECSSCELWDVIRLDDKYNRENTEETDYN